MSNLEIIKKEITEQLADKEVFNALVTTTFKGLDAMCIKKAIFEGMSRGFKFDDFLKKHIYAIPYKNTYSLVTSIDYARKIGMRAGVVGKSAPTFEEKDGKIISCTITIKRKVEEHVGDYTAMVFFDEYSTGRNLWVSKPRTMLAKVAEMHALRMACPEELSQSYVEEEVEEEKEVVIDLTPHKVKLEAVKTLDELKVVWSSLPVEAKQGLEEIKNELKCKFTSTPTEKNGLEQDEEKSPAVA
jgi:hypothetical protein